MSNIIDTLITLPLFISVHMLQLLYILMSEEESILLNDAYNKQKISFEIYTLNTVIIIYILFHKMLVLFLYFKSFILHYTVTCA